MVKGKFARRLSSSYRSILGKLPGSINIRADEPQGQGSSAYASLSGTTHHHRNLTLGLGNEDSEPEATEDSHDHLLENRDLDLSESSTTTTVDEAPRHEVEPGFEQGNKPQTQTQIQRLHSILEHTTPTPSPHPHTPAPAPILTKILQQRRLKAMEQQLARIEGLRRDHEALQMKCDEIQMRYDKRHKELRG